MIFWTTTTITTDDEDKINDDIRNGLPTRNPIYPAHRGVPVQDRARTAGSDIGRIITPELAFVAIMIGFGLVLIVGTLLGIVEVGHE